MQVDGVDPRDRGWEVDEPIYRVYFHDANGASDEYEVSGADVRSVIEWADGESGDRTYVLYARVSINGLGLLRLQGHDPNDRQSLTDSGISEHCFMPKASQTRWGCCDQSSGEHLEARPATTCARAEAVLSVFRGRGATVGPQAA